MATPIGSVQGLASGINFRDLVAQIVNAERAPARILESRMAAIAVRRTGWQDFRTRIQALSTAAAGLADGSAIRTNRATVSGSASAQLSVSAGTTASPGAFSARVLALATREKIGSGVFAERSEALGIAGEFLIGGKAVSVSADQSLEEIAAVLNEANRGASPTGVAASIVAAPSGGHRLILTAAATGSAGVGLADGSAGALGALGFLDSTTTLRHATSSGAAADSLASGTSAVGTLLGLSSAPSGTVTIGGLAVAVDLATDSLQDVADAVNDAAALAGSSVTAAMEESTDAKGVVTARLVISGTLAFADAGGVLETLGVLERGRSAVAQTVSGDALTAGDDSTAAVASTLLTDLWSGGSAGGAAVGDTLTLSGTRGDGTTFQTTLTVAADTDVQDLLDALNSGASGFGVGTRPATASLSAEGRIVVTDGTAGASRLALSVVSDNVGGGRLDFGDFDLTVEGHARELVAGADAQIEVDGAVHVRSSNVVTDVLAGVTLRLASVSSEAVTVEVTHDDEAAVGAVNAFVKAYNAVASYVNDQGTSGPLAGDSLVRAMRSRLRAALGTSLGTGVSRFGSLSEMGVRLNRNGLYDVNADELRAAIASDPESVANALGEYAAGKSGVIDVLGSSAKTGDGAYPVVVTQAATRAAVTGAGFGGVYVDDGTADVLRITDASTGSVYDVSLADGMTLDDIVRATNTELATRTARKLQGATLHGAASAAASGSTTLAELADAADAPLGVAAGDRFTISGTTADGRSFVRHWTIDDPSTQTLADLAAEISTAVGAGVGVTIENGVLTVTATVAGRSPLAVSVTSDDAGGGSFPSGAFAVAQAGRGSAHLTASAEGGELRLLHDEYGSALGFDVAFVGGGSAGTASLGLAEGSYRGVDVAGTIGGQAATGAGRQLTADAGTAAEGLMIRYLGSTTGAVGSVTYSRGLAGLLKGAADALGDGATGAIQGTLDALDTQVRGLQDRVARLDDRLERRSADLNARFVKLEEAMARAQQRAAWLQSQLGSLSNG